MEIKINGRLADITLETEKTVVEVLSGLHQWLERTAETAGHSVSGVEIDGKNYGSLSLEEAFDLPLADISSMNIKTSSQAELMLEALVLLKKDLELYKELDAEEQFKFSEHWEKSVTALFFKDHEQNLYNIVRKFFKESSAAEADDAAAEFSVTNVISFITERIREIENPMEEMKTLLSLAEETAKGLEDLPLLMQTGKDNKAAETIMIFSSLMEKIFRLIYIIKYFGTDIESIEVSSMNGSEKQSLKDYISEFSAALKELLSAFENKDTVLVGDLSEYELAPRLRQLVSVLSTIKTGN